MVLRPLPKTSDSAKEFSIANGLVIIRFVGFFLFFFLITGSLKIK